MEMIPTLRKVDVPHGSVGVGETYDEVHIVITDITFHATEACNPQSFARNVQKTLRNGKSGRAYYNKSMQRKENGQFEVTLPLFDGLAEVIEKARVAGKRVRIFIPKNGIPMLAGKDVAEKAAALKRQGLL